MRKIKSVLFSISNYMIISLLFCACDPSSQYKVTHGKENRKIHIKGSDTEYEMVQDLAEAYMIKHPDVTIVVEGGGSNIGIEALLKNEIDICNSSREITKKELNNINNITMDPIRIMFSVDALALITHYKVGVDSLSTQQISNIFNGNIKNWKELGGEDIAIHLFGRDKSSGTRNYFNAKFLSNDTSEFIKECTSNQDILNSIIKTPGGVGYVGAGFLFDKNGKPNGKIWAMPIYIHNQRAISPYESYHVKKGEYILTRPLYQYTANKPNELIEDFILFELTKIGQDIIMKHGYFPINDYQKEINTLKGLP